MAPALSILDLATVGPGEDPGAGLKHCVELAQTAERLGFSRVWYAEHHNFASIASSATSVLIAHVAAHTRHIRLGSAGIMLPNHSPLVIAEQFGTLAHLHPGRIDLGLGRAPGTDQRTLRALRRDPMASERFPQDVQELQAFLGEESLIPGVRATPGQGTHVPLYILGSSTFGAQLAAALGLPYGFASHFAPGALELAVSAYRERFEPSAQAAKPYVMAGVNVIAAKSQEEAEADHLTTLRQRVSLILGMGRRTFTDEEADAILASPEGFHVRQMATYSAVGTVEKVRAYLDDFAKKAQADELIIALNSVSHAQRVQTLELVAENYGLTPRS